MPRHGDRRAGGLARLNLADVAVAQDEYETAIVQAFEAQSTLLEEQDPYNAARAATVLGLALGRRGRVEAADDQLAAALAYFRDVDAGFEIAHALEALGELAQRHGDPAAARRHFEEAIDRYSQLGVPRAAAVRERLDRLDVPEGNG